MARFHSAITIGAPVERIWGLLIDGAQWPSWTSTVERVEGSVTPGGSVTVVPAGSDGKAFPLRVEEFSPPQRLVLGGGLPLGLFRGLRTYALTPISPDHVTVSVTETFSGLLAPLITRSIPNLQPAFDAFTADLKAAAERR